MFQIDTLEAFLPRGMVRSGLALFLLRNKIKH